MSFILNNIKPEEVTEPIVEDVVEEVVEEVVEPIVEEPVVEPIVEEPVIEEAPTSQEIDYKEFLESNEDVLFTYLKEKRTDYGSLGQLELVKMKIKADNPEFDSSDVEAEMQDRYGVDLEKIEIDEDTMTDEELAQAKAHNKEVDKQVSKGNRELKKDASVASKYFEENKSKIELPKFEVEAKQAKVETAVFDQDAFQEEQIKQYTEYKEKTWLPQLKAVIEPFESLKKQVEYEDNGNKVVLDVDYKVSKEEKAEIESELADYISQPSDSKYTDDKGNIDLQRFVSDKVAEKFHEKLLKTVAKEAAARARKEFVKNDLLNFDDGIRDKAPASTGETDFSKNFFAQAAQASKKQL